MIKQVKFDEHDIAKILRPETRTSRFFRGVKRVFFKILALALTFAVFFLLLNLPAYWMRFRYAVSAPVYEPVKQVEQPVVEPEIEYESLVEIPKLGISAPLHPEIDPDNIIEVLKGGIAHYAETALPGERGNSVLVGHSSDFPWSNGQYKTVFSLLDKLEAGDEIVVYFGTQRLTYTVNESRVVHPTDVSVLARSDSPLLTLITCYPVGTTTNRLIVTAKLTKGKITGTQVSEPAIQPLPQAR